MAGMQNVSASLPPGDMEKVQKFMKDNKIHQAEAVRRLIRAGLAQVARPTALEMAAQQP